MKNKKLIIGIASLAVLALLFFFIKGKKKDKEVVFEYAKVEKSNIQNSITATGTIEPVTSVTVGTQVSGIVSRLYVDYNSVVRKGQVIAELDKTNLMSELNTARANLSSAESSLSYQRSNYERYRTLYNKGLISADDFENARLTYQQATQQVSQARENVRHAQTNLSYATITSPIDGVVLSKSVEEGQTVAASFNTPELVANVDEADIGDIKPGERVTFTVDAYPNDTFTGAVKQVRQEAKTTNNVVTYEVIISAPNGDLKLKPGLTANVTIYTHELPNVLSVPSKALRYTPTQETIGKHKIKDCKGKNKVWTLEGNVLTAHSVNVGMSDGTHTQIVSGINEGQSIVVGVKEDSEDDSSEQTARSPFAPGPPNKNKKK